MLGDGYTTQKGLISEALVSAAGRQQLRNTPVTREQLLPVAAALFQTILLCSVLAVARWVALRT